jgi:serine/threonine protein kinase
LKTAEDRVGTLIASYRLDSVLGTGGMGVVYRAWHTTLQRPVAVKLIAPEFAHDQTFRELFLTEARQTASLDHPNIVRVHDAGEWEGELFVAMQLIEGPDLGFRLQGPVETSEVVHWLGQIALALDAAHDAGLVHGDVKPTNILITGARLERALLTDFGIAAPIHELSGSSNRSLGAISADYAAPEQIRQLPLGPASDVYSLAAVLFESLTGVPLFDRQSEPEVIAAQLVDAPPSIHGLNPELPADLDPILFRGLAKEPSDRYASCVDLLSDVRAVLGLNGNSEVGHRRTVSAPPPAASLLPAMGPRAQALTSLDDQGARTLRSHAGSRAAQPSARHKTRFRFVLAALVALPVVLGAGIGLALEFAKPSTTTISPSHKAAAVSTNSATSSPSPTVTLSESTPSPAIPASQSHRLDTPFWTVLLASRDDLHGGRAAAAREARDASSLGVEASVLHSTKFSSLNPGYWVVYTGRFADEGPAAERARGLHARGFADAYARCVGTLSECAG